MGERMPLTPLPNRKQDQFAEIPNPRKGKEYTTVMSKSTRGLSPNSQLPFNLLIELKSLEDTSVFYSCSSISMSSSIASS
ncbi:hypothetical protein TNCV_3958001 [Trichonephila clavipes]|nr:hypothetical protein TNCV_3958001 [Trichonephila clavipes]